MRRFGFLDRSQPADGVGNPGGTMSPDCRS
jgi:hypothetical protein